ncbi:MAG TPA: hypothetical protein VGT81_10960, partial [Casimicrobiaceae bacterium]|nr:hypothetical protein [Casimicrobiaceae bacterium]
MRSHHGVAGVPRIVARRVVACRVFVTVSFIAGILSCSGSRLSVNDLGYAPATFYAVTACRRQRR